MADTATKPDTDTKATEDKTGRAARLEKLAKASTFTVVLEPAVRRLAAAKAKKSGLDMNHFVQKLIEDHLIDTAEEDNPVVARLRAKRAVLSRVVELAQKLDAEGKFDEEFILTVVREAEKDAEFAALYATATGADETGKAPVKFARAINQQIGRMIKRAVGASSKRNDSGRIARGQVKDALISAYTLLEKPS